MRREEIDRKLRWISGLCPKGLEGWIWAQTIVPRPPFDGELAALQRRAKQLGVPISYGRKDTSHGGIS